MVWSSSKSTEGLRTLHFTFAAATDRQWRHCGRAGEYDLTFSAAGTAKCLQSTWRRFDRRRRDPGIVTSKAPPTIRACAATGPEQPRHGIPARPVIVRRNPGAARRASRELTVEELLAAPIVRRLMERDGVDPEYVRALIASITRVSAKSR
jgi:hypothetical protein